MSGIKTVLRAIGTILIILVLLFALLLDYLTVTEFRPDGSDSIDIIAWDSEEYGITPGSCALKLPYLTQNETLRIVTWNTGYGALGETADFFMDGGSHVITADEFLVKENVTAMTEALTGFDADILFLQETDQNSTRSHHYNEVEAYREAFHHWNTTFANNFRVPYVPYPIPPIGKVDSGILTLSPHTISGSTRVSLPCPFSWPVRIANLKRCLLVDRLPIAESDKELVAINLHLEAYDDGEGKIAQTKALLSLLEEESAKGNYVIAGGDFNQTFSNCDLSAYPINESLWLPGIIDAADFGSDWSLLMDSAAPTCRSLDQPLAGADAENFQYYMIDGFIVSKNIEVESVRTEDLGFKNTDHNPVVMDFMLK